MKLEEFFWTCSCGKHMALEAPKAKGFENKLKCPGCGWEATMEIRIKGSKRVSESPEGVKSGRLIP